MNMPTAVANENGSHRLAGKTVKLNLKPDSVYKERGIDGKEFRIEDWWVNITGQNWMRQAASGNPACMLYDMHNNEAGLPKDDEVVYGKVGSLGYLVHESELGEEVQ